MKYTNEQNGAQTDDEDELNNYSNTNFNHFHFNSTLTKMENNVLLFMCRNSGLLFKVKLEIRQKMSLSKQEEKNRPASIPHGLINAKLTLSDSRRLHSCLSSLPQSQQVQVSTRHQDIKTVSFSVTKMIHFGQQ